MLVGDRVITIDGNFGTIRFIGKIPAWADQIAWGIEWDTIERGKNDGSIDGVRYFQTQGGLKSGSFMKSNTNKLDSRRFTFEDVLLNRYRLENSGHSEEVTFGSKTTESLGFEKLSEIQSDFKNLKVITLQRENIVLSLRLSLVLDQLQELHTLDLGYNLMVDLNEVWAILHGLKGLRCLVLNGNKFVGNPDRVDDKREYPFLKSLFLIDTNISITEVGIIVKKFPSLEEISLSKNGYTDREAQELAKLLTQLGTRMMLSSIDLSFNEFTKVPNLAGKFKVVNLANNKIHSAGTEIHDTRVLDLRYNEISSWNSIDQLYRCFPQLNELRINGNPLFENLTLDEMTINLIARFECSPYSSGSLNLDGLCKLNGVYLTKDEIENSELYFISKVKQGQYKFDTQLIRWQKLAVKYKISLEDTDNLIEFTEETPLQGKILPLDIIYGNKSFTRIFLKTNTVLRVKGWLAQREKLNLLDIELKYYIDEEVAVERIMEDNLAMLNSYGLQKGQKIYVHTTKQ